MSVFPDREQIALHLPRRLAFGAGCRTQCVEDWPENGPQKVFVVTIEPLLSTAQELVDGLKAKCGAECLLDTSILQEPTFADCDRLIAAAKDFGAEAVIGLGGGSVLDVAKLVAAVMDTGQALKDVVGIGKLEARSTPLICLPTTAGTGSEVSPNAILSNEEEQIKQGIVSPYLMPDASYVDPELTYSVPAAPTAAQGIDALVHCVEAYANKFAHPLVDGWALRGIELIGQNLPTACAEGSNTKARDAVALGSMFGGFCLGPVNTGAVHALAYPLGGEYHIPHGLANSMLLPHVLEFNLPAMPQRYAEIAKALDVDDQGDDMKTAEAGLEKIRELCKACKLPSDLTQIGIPAEDVDKLAASAITVQRLLKNNPREVTEADAAAIYRSAMGL